MNHFKFSNRQLSSKTKILVSFAIISTIVLFFVSPDSYTHDLFYTTDSATFFMCGKAWMNGMTPYVDFADSKGPLLWLIYGTGYLLSHYNYIGIFWLSCILYTFIYWYVFKISTIFLKSHKLAFFCSILMTLFFFNSWFHYEIRAEDWCLLFISISIYYTSSILYTQQSDKKSINKTCFILGLCLASTILIKYSIGIMLGTISLYFLSYIIHEKKNVVAPFLSYILGISVMFLPFLIYFLSNHIFHHFVNEYFINTFLTIKESNNFHVIIRELLSIFDPRICVLFTLSLLGSILISRKVNRYKYFFILTFLGFFCIATHHAFYYYYSSCFIFSLPIYIVLCDLYRKYIITHFYKLICKTSFAIFCIIILSNYTFITSGYLLPNLFFTNNNLKTDYYNITHLMSQIESPSIIYYEGGERGYGLAVGSLPGSKYWITQYGASEAMKKVQLADIKKQKADFIVIDDTKPGIDRRKAILDSAEYTLCYSAINSTTYLYSKHPIKVVSLPDSINMWNILLKRKIYNTTQ